MDDELTLTLNSPITEEQWDDIMDVDFDHTDRITFHTKHGKEVEFVKRKKGKWILEEGWDGDETYKCSECKALWMFLDGTPGENEANFCPVCGADMREGEQDEGD